MNADTIHLHHLVFRETKSYVGTLIPIFVVTLITGIGTVLFFQYGFGYLAMQLFLLVLVVFVITPPVPFYVPLASRITKYVTSLKTSRFSNKHLFRIRYLPFLGAAYLICVVIKYYQPNIIETLNPTLIIGLGALLLFALLGILKEESFQVGLILVVLFQIFSFSFFLLRRRIFFKPFEFFFIVFYSIFFMFFFFFFGITFEFFFINFVPLFFGFGGM